ncbi:MAG: hypothetical protein LBB91_11915, partial [Clostridiales bacterium]|nr:hypothetical protein [Clostridiales bacterium]
MLKNEFAVVCDSAEFDSEHVLQILSKVRLLAGSAQNKVMVVCVGPYQTERLRVLSRYGADHIVICERAAITDMDEYSNIVG